MKKTTKKQNNEALIIDVTDFNNQVAECAYYKAEQRGFLPGYEEQDWIEAEHEMLNKQVSL